MNEDGTAAAPRPTRLVVDRQKIANKVVAAFEANAPVVSKGTDAAFADVLRKGEQAPDVAEWMAIAARALAHVRDEMVAADLAHQAELGDDDAPRAARDAHEVTLRNAITELQEVATGLYGQGVLATFHLAGAPPADPRGLVTHAQNAVLALREVDRGALPPLRVKRAEVDLADWADKLAGPADLLNEALGAVETEARELQITQAAKNEAIKHFDARFRASVAALEGLLSFAGHPDLAERVKPALRGATTEPAAQATSAEA